MASTDVSLIWPPAVLCDRSKSGGLGEAGGGVGWGEGLRGTYTYCDIFKN